MKILVSGDLHGKIETMPRDIDLILITGDIGKSDLARKMAFENVRRNREGLPEKEFSPQQEKKAYIQSYNHSIKIIKYLSRKFPVYLVYGNVESSDLEVRKLSEKIRMKLPLLGKELKKIHNVKIINNRIANFRGLKIGGLKYFVDVFWVKKFKPNNYKEAMRNAKKETEKSKRVLRWFGKNDIDVLLCHQPPYGILDKVTAKYAPKHWRGKHAGSKTILDYIKKEKPRYVFCGHIHEAKGNKKFGKTEIYNVGALGDYVSLEID